MALKTNSFWTGAGWTHSVLGFFGSKKSAEKASARAEAAKGARSSGIELWATLGQGLSTNELKTGLQLIEVQLAEFGHDIETKKMTLAELEAGGERVKNDLENVKVNLFQDSALTKKLVGMARVKVREQISSGVFLGEETVEKAVSAKLAVSPEEKKLLEIRRGVETRR